MNLPPELSIDRRGFFKTAVRSSMLLLLTAFTAWQQAKRRRLANDPACIKLMICQDCVEFGTCPKAKAQSAKRSV